MGNLLNEIYYFILPYLSNDGKLIECITEFNNYNMGLIEKNRDKILEFVIKHFNIRKGSMRMDELLYSKDDNKMWNELSTLEDLSLLDKLVGLLIAVGILEDSYLTRINSFGNMGIYGEFLIKENFCFFDDETTKNYLITIRHYILPFYRFNVKEDTFEYMTRFSAPNQNEELKEIILDWIKTSTLPIRESDINTINGFLNFNTEQFLNAIVMGFSSEEGPEVLVNYLRFDPEFDYMAKINSLLTSYNDNQKEDFENKKRLFLSRIEESVKKRRLQ